jgi:hypothetical protein
MPLLVEPSISRMETGFKDVVRQRNHPAGADPCSPADPAKHTRGQKTSQTILKSFSAFNRV